MIRDPDVPFLTALKRRCSDTRGLALTEAIAAAAVLAILALGVLAGLDGAASSTGREKARSVASALAEKDQERLHAKRAVDLPDLNETDNPVVGGIEYTVVSEVDWISDTSGGTLSCTSNGGKADYLRLRTTVTSATVGKRTDPVKLESLVTPPLSSAGGNTGTLAVQVKDRDDLGVKDLAVNIKGAGTGYAAAETTNEIGCAIFAQVPADSYDIWVNTPGWVDKGGVQEVHTNSQVSSGGLSLANFVYDQAGTVKVGFDTAWWNPLASSGAGALAVTKSSAWWLSADHADVPAGGIRRYMVKNGSGTQIPAETIVADKLFPFKGNYGLHSGYCIEENPANQGVDPAWVAANAFQLIDPATNYDRTIAPTKPVRQPSLPVRVFNGTYPSSYSVTSLRNKKWWLGSANVVAKLIPEQANSQCNDKELILGVSSNSTYGLTTYPLGRTYSGTSNGDSGITGMVTKKPGALVEFDPGLPFGTWQLCVHSDVSGTNRKKFATVDNTHTGTPAAISEIDMSTGTTSGTCPTTATSGWPTP
jgi:hypothetical protein